MKDSPGKDKEEKPKNNANGEVQDGEVEPTKRLLKDWRYATSHPKDLIIGDVSKLHDICGHFAFISHIEPKNILEVRATYIGCFPCKKSSINLSATKFDILILDPMINQQLILNGFYGISWMSREMLFGIKLG